MRTTPSLHVSEYWGRKSLRGSLPQSNQENCFDDCRQAERIGLRVSNSGTNPTPKKCEFLHKRMVGYYLQFR